MARRLTPREREVLDALLAVDFDGVEELRRSTASVEVGGGCGCGCPSVDFAHPPVDEPGMTVLVDAVIEGSEDGLFLYAEGPWLGGIEYVGAVGDDAPNELPAAQRLRISLAKGVSWVRADPPRAGTLYGHLSPAKDTNSHVPASRRGHNAAGQRHFPC